MYLNQREIYNMMIIRCINQSLPLNLLKIYIKIATMRTINIMPVQIPASKMSPIISQDVKEVKNTMATRNPNNFFELVNVFIIRLNIKV